MKIASYGGGTNSTAMLIELAEIGETVDLILFADTGGEKPYTYKYVDMFSGWLVNHGMPEITTVKSRIPLEQDCLERHALPSVAYGFKTCSQRWKAQPQEKFVNNWQPAKDFWKSGGKIEKLIGFDADEPQRAREFEDKKYIARYPLIEWDYGRDECINIILDADLPLPGKSACFFCPSSKKQEILQLARQYPDLALRAIQMEENAELTQVKGLGRSFAWGDLIYADKAQCDMFPESLIDIDCGCYDG